MTISDYIYFRVAKYFFKKDGTSSPRAIAIVSIVQALLVGELFFMADRYLLKIELQEGLARFAGISIAGVILILNYKRYSGKYFTYREIWLVKEKPKNYKAKGYLVVVAILAPFLLLLLMTDNSFFNKLF